MCEIDIVEKLKDAPVGTELYCTILGKVKLVHVDLSRKDYPIKVKIEVTLVKVDSSYAWKDTNVGIEVSVVNRNTTRAFLNDGRYYDYKDSECLLFPSRDIRDWSLVKGFREDLHRGTLCLVSDSKEFISCGKMCPIYGSIRYYRGDGTCSASMEEGDTSFY